MNAIKINNTNGFTNHGCKSKQLIVQIFLSRNNLFNPTDFY